MEPDARDESEVSFGDFSIEGLEDPLAPRAHEEYVEELDADPAPTLELDDDPNLRGYPFDRTPISGAASLRGPSGRLLRIAAVFLLGITAFALVVSVTRMFL